VANSKPLRNNAEATQPPLQGPRLLALNCEVLSSCRKGAAPLRLAD
jgi:hypothetical protein